MSKPEPLLSICVPTHHGRRVALGRLLDSVAAQLGEVPAGAVEVVVSDNASQDGTRELVAEHAARHPGVIAYHRNERDLGGTANILLAVERSRGRWCWSMGSDDRPAPGALASVLRAVRDQPGVAGITFDFTTHVGHRDDPVFAYAREIYPDMDARPARYDDPGAVLRQLGLLFGYLSIHVVRRAAWDAAAQGPVSGARMFGHALRLSRIALLEPAWAWNPAIAVRRGVDDSSWTRGRPAWRYHVRANREIQQMWRHELGLPRDTLRTLRWRWYHLCGDPATVVALKVERGARPRRDLAMLAAWTAAFWREPRFWRHTLPVLLTPGRLLAADPALREERVRAYRRRRPRQVAPPVPPADERTVPGFVRARGMHRLLLRPRLRDSVARLFHLAYFGAFGRTLRGTHWLGSETLKFPSDLWIYQELLHELRPALVVEAGTYRGGSARFLATCCDAIGTGHIVTIDPAAEAQPPHPRITYIDGSSTDPATVERVRAMLPGEGHVMVILDSDHSRDHVLAELRVWAPLVTSGSYLVVEDTNLNGHPVLPDWGPGPAEAVAQILEERCDLVPDPTRERFLVSACPGGFLRKR